VGESARRGLAVFDVHRGGGVRTDEGQDAAGGASRRAAYGPGVTDRIVGSRNSTIDRLRIGGGRSLVGATDEALLISALI
jgi:hypothetical protein